MKIWQGKLIKCENKYLTSIIVYRIYINKVIQIKL